MSEQSDLPSVTDRFGAFAISMIREEGRLFGKPYTRLGSLFISAGYWLFQSGGALGYGLRGHPVILGKLLGSPPKSAGNYVQEVLLNLASEQLTQASGKDKNFFQLYLIPTLAEYGYELSLEDKSWLTKKQDFNEAISQFMQIIFQKGVSVGFNFPEELSTYWNETHSQRTKEEWAEMYKRGMVSSPQQDTLKLQDEVSVALTSAADWVRERAPTQLTAKELSTLDKLISKTS